MTDLNWRHGVLLLVCTALVALTLLHGPIPQPAAYHQFADDRTLWSIPNAWNVLSNLPFAFMGLLTATLAERVSVRWARHLFIPLLLLGAASAVYWYLTERAGHGDLGPYVILVQGGSLLLILLMVVLFPARYGGTGFLYGGLALYALAKIFEDADRSAFLWRLGIGGHCVKHVLAAAAVGLLACRLSRFGQTSDALTANSPLRGELR